MQFVLSDDGNTVALFKRKSKNKFERSTVNSG